MGQAKKRQSALAEQILVEGQKWMFPESDWERAVYADLMDKEVLRVQRASKQELHDSRMKPKECHTNVWWYVEHDPEKKSKAVVGWWVQWPDFVLHSVVERDEELFCITPSAFDEGSIHFIPDKKIEWRKLDSGYAAFRDGQEVGIGIRAFPEFTMARIVLVKERLLSGMKPMEAMNLSPESLQELHRKYVAE
jgi:hypothetical protein